MAKKFEINEAGAGALLESVGAKAKKGSYTQKAATPEEKAEREAEGRTQGRKGCKAPRINIAFTSENWDFLRVMAKLKGQNMTQFCNEIITQYREAHGETYQKLKKLAEELEK